MPNWCQNTLVVKGGKKELARLKKAAYLKYPDKDDYSETGETFFSLNNLIPMPKELENTTSPVRDSDSKANKALRKKYGFDNWYDWHHANWGIKWDVEATKAEGSNWVKFHFDSPWGPPNIAIEKISRLYPTLTFEIEYAEPGMNFAGRILFKDGTIISQEELAVEDVTDNLTF